MVNMARSVFYYHLSRLKDNDGYDDTRKRIKAIYDDNKGRYGYRRICLSLRNEGCNINHKTVQKLMSQMGLKAKRKKRHYHSYKGQTERSHLMSLTGISQQKDQTRNGQRTCHWFV